MSELRQEDMWTLELKRIYTYLERHIAPDDQPLVKNAFGIDEKTQKQKWAEMAVAGD